MVMSMPIIAMTINNSINVDACRHYGQAQDRAREGVRGTFLGTRR